MKKRNFTFRQVRLLLKAQRKLLKKFGLFSNDAITAANKVRSSYNDAYEMSFQNKLKQVHVNEINFDKSGIRIKALVTAGIESLYELNNVSENQVANIYGISQNGARHIKNNARKVTEKHRNSFKFRINRDDQTFESSQLVIDILDLADTVETKEEAEKLVKKINDNIGLFNNIRSGRNFVKWFFSSDEAKDKAINSFEATSEFVEELKTEYQELFDKYYLKKKVNQVENWYKFEKKAAKYNGILDEALHGNSFSSSDYINLETADKYYQAKDVYGLTNLFAKEIEKQELNLNGLKCRLRNYQVWGVRYVIHQKRTLLGDEMGLGKTIQAIAAMVHLRNTGEKHFIVICPASVLVNWIREIRQHSDLDTYKLHGDTFDKDFAKWFENGGVAVTTYETIYKINQLPKSLIGLQVVDEAHYAKNPDATRSYHTERISQYSKNVLFMTGTPIENNTNEMCNLVRILDSELSKKLRIDARNADHETFKKDVEKVYYRRKRDDVLTELPDLINEEDWCEMTQSDLSKYIEALEKGDWTQIRRVSWNSDDISDSSKANRLKEIIDEAKEEDRKVIVFSFYLDTIKRIKEMFGDICTEPITGSVSTSRRQQIIDEFSTSENKNVLIAQIVAGGTGLNIQAASVIVLCEPQFKPSIENQAISRAYRMGQTRNVIVHRLLCEKSADEKVFNMLKMKQMIFDKYADESELAKKNLEIDDVSFKNIVYEEQNKYNVNRSSN